MEAPVCARFLSKFRQNFQHINRMRLQLRLRHKLPENPGEKSVDNPVSRSHANTVWQNQKSLTGRNQQNLTDPRNFMLKFSTCADGGNDGSVGRDRYHPEVESAVNQQIFKELSASYAYLAIACYFGRTEVALPGCHGFFMDMYQEEIEHGMIFINYQNVRGGRVLLCPIPPPEDDFTSVIKALQVSIEMEKNVKTQLLNLHTVAEKHNDYNVMDMVDGQFLSEQDRSICEISRLLVRIKKMGESGISEFLFDKEMHNAFVKKKENALVKLEKVYK